MLKLKFLLRILNKISQNKMSKKRCKSNDDPAAPASKKGEGYACKKCGLTALKENKLCKPNKQ